MENTYDKDDTVSKNSTVDDSLTYNTKTMSIIEKQKENLIVQRAMLLFFYNFNTYPNIIDEMKSENSGFDHAWEKLSKEATKESNKSGWMATIDFKDFYGLFATKLTYKAQAMLLEKVLDKYYKQAAHDIDFSIEIDEAQVRVKTKRSEK